MPFRRPGERYPDYVPLRLHRRPLEYPLTKEQWDLVRCLAGGASSLAAMTFVYHTGIASEAALRSLSPGDVGETLRRFLEQHAGSCAYQGLVASVCRVATAESAASAAAAALARREPAVYDAETGRPVRDLDPETYASTGFFVDMLPGEEQRGLFLKMFAPHTRVGHRERGRLRHGMWFIFRNGLTVQKVREELDGPTIAELVDAEQRAGLFDLECEAALTAQVHRMCLNPYVDVDGRFRSHARWVRRSCLAACQQQHPMVWRYTPSVVGRILELSAGDAVSRERMFEAMNLMVAHRLGASSLSKIADRVFRSVSQGFLDGVVAPMLHTPEARGRFLEWFGCESRREDVLRAAAVLVGCGNAKPRLRVSRNHAECGPTGGGRSLYGINSMIVSGCFPHIRQTDPVRVVELTNRVFAMETEDPERYALQPPPKRVKSCPPLDDAVIDRLLSVAVSRKEVLYVELSSYTGLRRGAMELAELASVWDDGLQDVREAARFMEKGSKTRVVLLAPGASSAAGRVREALALYIREELLPSRTRWLFPCAADDGVSYDRDLCYKLLNRLCARLGLPRGTHHHHQFRHNVVNRHCRRGGKLEAAQKFLGHSTVNTTYRHYWTDTVDLMQSSPPRQGGGDDCDLAERVRELEAENLLLRRGGIPSDDVSEDDEDDDGREEAYCEETPCDASSDNIWDG